MTYSKELIDLYQVKTSGDNLMLRSGAGTNYSIIDEMPNGSFVCGLGAKENNFLMCCFMSSLDQNYGYASLDYLVKVGD